jgi:hypothetical protein
MNTGRHTESVGQLDSPTRPASRALPKSKTYIHTCRSQRCDFERLGASATQDVGHVQLSNKVSDGTNPTPVHPVRSFQELTDPMQTAVVWLSLRRFFQSPKLRRWSAMGKPSAIPVRARGCRVEFCYVAHTLADRSRLVLCVQNSPETLTERTSTSHQSHGVSCLCVPTDRNRRCSSRSRST